MPEVAQGWRCWMSILAFSSLLAVLGGLLDNVGCDLLSRVGQKADASCKLLGVVKH